MEGQIFQLMPMNTMPRTRWAKHDVIVNTNCGNKSGIRKNCD